MLFQSFSLRPIANERFIVNNADKKRVHNFFEQNDWKKQLAGRVFKKRE